MSDIDEFPPGSAPIPNANAIRCISWHGLQTTEQYRRYVARIVMTVKTDAWTRQINKKVLYRIGTRSCQAVHIFKRCNYEQSFTPQKFRLNTKICRELESIVKRYDKNYPSFAECDLSGVMHVLGRAVGYFQSGRYLTCEMIRCGQPVNISSLATLSKTELDGNSVFIPHQEDFILFTVLAAAVNANGVGVFTNYVYGDLNKVALSEEEEIADCFYAVWGAVRALFAMADASDAGAVMAAAFTSGLHSAVTVLSHTAEGGLVGDMLRNVGYARPRGAIYTKYAHRFTGLPELDEKRSFLQLGEVIDSVVLITAAQAARADPLVKRGNAWYPSVFYVKESKEKQSLLEIAEKQLKNVALRGQKFCRNYAALLSATFEVSGGEGIAAEALCQGFGNIPAEGNPHACFRAIAPFYWIEPTTLFPRRDPQIVADLHGYGVLCGTKESAQMPFYELGADMVETDMEERIRIRWRSARTVGLVLAGLGKDNNQLEDVNLWSFGGSQMGLWGGGQDRRMVLRSRLHEILWKHSDAMVPAPAECLYGSAFIDLRICKRRVDKDGEQTYRTQLPTREDGIGDDAGISMLATFPTWIAAGDGGEKPRFDTRRVGSFCKKLYAAMESSAGEAGPS